jgi:hypothetical protein
VVDFSLNAFSEAPNGLQWLDVFQNPLSGPAKFPYGVPPPGGLYNYFSFADNQLAAFPTFLVIYVESTRPLGVPVVLSGNPYECPAEDDRRFLYDRTAIEQVYCSARACSTARLAALLNELTCTDPEGETVTFYVSGMGAAFATFFSQLSEVEEVEALIVLLTITVDLPLSFFILLIIISWCSLFFFS